MINRLKPKSEFTRNVLTLMTGTTMAQAIPLAASPILTRIYSPEDFGLFALFMSLAVIFSVIATGRYELAIMLPSKEEEARSIVFLSVLINIIISLTLFLIISLFNAQITNLLGKDEISPWLYVLPFTVFLLGLFKSLNFWNNRGKKYKSLAFAQVSQSGMTAGANLSFGFLGYSSIGLIIGNILGQIISIGMLSRSFFKTKIKIDNLKIIALAKKYKFFPKFSVLSGLINVSSKEIPKIIIANILEMKVLGFLSLAQRMMIAPIALFSSSIQQVFFQSATKEYKEKGNVETLYRSTRNKLFIIAVIPFILLYIFAVDIFTFIFGDAWGEAGEIVKILVPFYFIYFIAAPLNIMFIVAEKQKLEIQWQITFFIMSIGSLLFSSFISSDMYFILTTFSISNALVFLYALYLTNKIAKG
jgi:O-antigen/teichoic acid export membrane protein